MSEPLRGPTLVFATLAIVVITAAPRPAHACTLLAECMPRPTLSLVGDVTSRPLNACIGVQYAGAPTYPERIAPELAYVASDGTRVPLEPMATWRLYCPRTPLDADTDYVLVGPELDAAFGACSVRSEVELLAFHTGAAMDTTPPSAPGTVEDVAPCAREECGDIACCGPYDTITHRTEWSASTDDSGEVAYAIDGELRTRTAYYWAETIPRPPYDVLFEREPHEVRAIDVAGNVGPRAVHGARCEGSWLIADAGVIDSGVIDSGVIDSGVLDAGTRAEVDASNEATDAASEVPTSDAFAIASDADLGAGGGCSAARPSHPSGVLLVILGLALRRRRHR